MIYYCSIIIWMEIEKSKVLIQFLLIFRQSGDVLFFLYGRRLRGYTATAVFVKTPFYVYRGTFLKKNFQKLYEFTHFLDFWVKCFRTLTERFSAGYHNCILRVLKNTLQKNWKNRINFFGHWAKDFRQGCQNCNLTVQRNILWFKILFETWSCSRGIGNSPEKKVYLTKEWFSFRNIHYDGK